MKRLLLLLLFILISCKKTINEKINKNQETFDFTADVIVKQDDDLILYYKAGNNEWFDEQHSIWVHVTGSEKIQRIKFSLPQDVLPNHLRFDFSKNPMQKPVKILKIKINYLDRSFEIKENDILNYFNINECIIFDRVKKIYHPIRDLKGVYDPYMLINEKFYSAMDNVITGE